MPVFGAGTYGGYGAGYSSVTNLTLVVQNVYPSRVLLTVTELVAGNVVTLTRRVAGSTIRVPVRGADGVEATTDALVRADAEAPYGVLLTYTLTVDGEDLEEETVTLTLAGGKVALSDAISGAAAETVILSWSDKRRERSASVFSVGGRNIVVSGQRGGFSGSIELFVETDDSKHQVLDLLQSATSGIVQIRQAGPYDGVDAYLAVLADTESRWSQDGSDPRRIIALDVVETERWAPGLESSTFTLQDLADAYTGLTLADLAGDYATLLDLAVADLS